MVYELRSVTKRFTHGATPVTAVADVSLAIEAGEFVVIQGPSGSGKTTLLQLLGGLDRPSSGAVLFDGRDLGRLGDAELTDLRSSAFGFVFQGFNLVPTLTARQNVEAALVAGRVGRRARAARAVELLESVGLAARANHLPTQLSGGEQQRVCIARALANAPRVLLADEPTGNLDSVTGADVIALLRSLALSQGQTLVIVTHDAGIAAGAGRIVGILDGRMRVSEPQHA